MNSKRRKRVRILGNISGLLSIFYCFLICMAVPDNWTPTIIIWSFLKKSRDFGTTEIGWDFLLCLQIYSEMW